MSLRDEAVADDLLRPSSVQEQRSLEGQSQPQERGQGYLLGGKTPGGKRGVTEIPGGVGFRYKLFVIFGRALSPITPNNINTVLPCHHDRA